MKVWTGYYFVRSVCVEPNKEAVKSAMYFNRSIHMSVKRNRDSLCSFSLQSVGGRQNFFNQLILLFNAWFYFQATLFSCFYFYFLSWHIYNHLSVLYFPPSNISPCIVMLTVCANETESVHLCPLIRDLFVCFGFISCKIIPSVMQPIGSKFSPVRISREYFISYCEWRLLLLLKVFWDSPQAHTHTHTHTHTHFAELHKLEILSTIVLYCIYIK